MYDVGNWQTNNYDIYILTNISRSEGNQTIKKYDQLIECNMRNSFPRKSCRKWRGRLVPDPFL